MSTNQRFKKVNRKKLRIAFLSVLISSALLLFLVGLWANVMLSAHHISEKIKEELVMTIYIDPLSKPITSSNLEKKLKQIDGIKSVDFISKERAAEAMKKELGNDFFMHMDFNPLFDSYDLSFQSEFVKNEHINTLEEQLLKTEAVYKIAYDRNVLAQLSANLKWLSYFFVGLCVIFLIIAIVLINNSIRLSIYSKRFSIRTMQLVGASNFFIQKPFLKTSFLQGFLAAIFAILLNYVVLYYLNRIIPSHDFLSNINYFLLSSGLILSLGIVLSLLSTIFAVRKYLNANLSDIYN
ncbi:MAG: cell division protein FtsX [Flavobacteriales bacterium]